MHTIVAELSVFSGALGCLKLHEIKSFKCLVMISKLISIFEHIVWLVTMTHETTIHILPELWHGILKLTLHIVVGNELLFDVILVSIDNSGTDGI